MRCAPKKGRPRIEDRAQTIEAKKPGVTPAFTSFEPHRRRTCDGASDPALRVRERWPMKRRDVSITTGMAVLAMQAAFLIALHFIRH